MVETLIGPMTDAVIDKIIRELKKKKTKEKIMTNIVDPLLCDLSTRYYPHFLIVTVILIIIVIMLLAILISIMFKDK